jgi:hypothetical protein
MTIHINNSDNNKPDALEQLPILRKQLLDKIAIALKQGGKANFFEATERLRSGDALLEQVVSLWCRDHHPVAAKNVDMSSDENADHSPSAKARGESVRSNWVNSNLGKSVTHVKGTLFRNGRGENLGIAYAKEAETRKDRWFLGLPETKFQTAILLCEPINGKLNALCLPSDFISQIKFSASHGQAKFMVIKRAGGWFLAVRGAGEVPVTEYVNNLAAVI